MYSIIFQNLNWLKHINHWRLVILSILFCTILCKKNQDNFDPSSLEQTKPTIKNGGQLIEFPEKSSQLQLFETIEAKFLDMEVLLKAPATVIGKVKKDDNNSPLILFASPELTSIYSLYLQNLSTIQIAKNNYNRTKDLFEHGAATGRELNEASSELYNKESTLAENEAKLRKEGFSPKDMKKAKVNTVWLISDLPETELNELHKGMKGNLEFPSFPGELFLTNIDAIAEVLNTDTRKVRIRLIITDPEDKIRPGMYGQVKFLIKANSLMIPREAVFSANAKFYVFIKASQHTFIKREVNISSETEEYVEIEHGISIGENVVKKNVMLLKGLSSGI